VTIVKQSGGGVSLQSLEIQSLFSVQLSGIQADVTHSLGSEFIGHGTNIAEW
jgi:hypothetical protein